MGAMLGLGKQKAPTVLPTPSAAPAVPTIDAAAQQQADADRLRRRQGRAATMLTGAAGDATGTTARKVLLGS